MIERLLGTNPSNGLEALISRNWQEKTLAAAIEDLAPSASLPPEFAKLLYHLGRKQAPMATFLRALFGQAVNNFSPVTSDPSKSEMLGFKKQKDYEAFLAESRLPRKLNQRKSRGGKIDIDYPWHREGTHKLPELASALGMTPEGLRKLCKRLRVPTISPKVARRAALIAREDAQRLLRLVWERPINVENRARERILKQENEFASPGV